MSNQHFERLSSLSDEDVSLHQNLLALEDGNNRAEMRSYPWLSEPASNNERIYTWSRTSWLGRLREFLKTHWHSLRTPKEEEGLDFEQAEDELYLQRVEELLESKTKPVLHFVCMWVNGAVIAVLVSLVSIVIDVSIEKLTAIKASHVNNQLVAGDGINKLEAFLSYLGFNFLFVSVAALLVAFLDIRAKGSGVPEIKSYLNGRKIHRVISFRTLVTKIAGVILSVSGSMIVGKEGPMIHAGAVIGAIVSQGRAELSSFGLSLLAFRTDSEKRKFVSIGCACGVAAAFSAPIGAVLFVIEEAASYWSVTLTWLTFFSSMLCAALVDVVLSGIKDSAQWGLMSQSAVVSFGSFEGASRDPCYIRQPNYTISHIPVFILIGLSGGLLGVVFNQLNLFFTRKRAKYVTSPIRRLIETSAVSILTSVILFGSAWLYPCKPLLEAEYVNGTRARFDGECKQLQPLSNFCQDGYFSDMETFTMNTKDKAVRMLFHSQLYFDEIALFWFGASIWFLACFTYGTNIPSGLFVPAIMIGAAFGRIVGQAIYENDIGTVDPGTYALIGAAASLGGITRMTISIVVILVETTNNVTFAVPIMITIMSAKIFGDLFNKGLYNIHVEFQGIKFLKDDPEPQDYKISVKDKMTKNPVVFHAQEKVGDIVSKLRSCSHNGFPVVSRDGVIGIRESERIIDSVENEDTKFDTKARRARLLRSFRSMHSDRMIFQGTILRRQLCILLWESLDNSKENPPHWKDFYKHYPRSPSILDVQSKLKLSDYDKIIDLTPCINRGALTVHYSVYMSRVHMLFRALGLRHLTIVDSKNQVLGIVTRHELLSEVE